MMLSSGTVRPTHYPSIRLRRYHMVHGVKVVRWCACFFNILIFHGERTSFVPVPPLARDQAHHRGVVVRLDSGTSAYSFFTHLAVPY